MRGGEKMETILRKFAHKVMLSQRFSPHDMYEGLEDKFQAYGYREPPQDAEKILVISLNAIGDNVLYSAFVRELRRNYPKSYIAMLVTPLVYPLVEMCPYVNKVWKLDYNPHEEVSAFFPRFMEFVCQHLLPHRFSLSFCVQWSDDKRPMNLLAYLSGARQRAAISDKSILAYNENFRLRDQWEFLLTHPVTTPVELTHEAERALYVLTAVGKNIVDTGTEVWLDAGDRYRAGRFTAGWSRYIVLGIGAGAANRKYPLDKWLTAMQEIYSRYQIPFVICGGREEAADGNVIEAQMPKGSLLNIAGKTSLRETAALIAGAYCYLGNVTGAMHMAAAVHTPLIALFREAQVRAEAPAGIYSESTRFAPWQAQAIVLQPDVAQGECLQTVIYGGCREEYAHCIAQIKPQEIVNAFAYLAEHFH